jgi:hypothetical protein
MNIDLLELAAERLGDLRNEVVFVGGATVELWITDPTAPDFRPTDDIDVIVEVSGRRGYRRVERRLENAGFEHDQDSGVMCRFRHRPTELILDVMPTDASILGFSNEWQRKAFPEGVIQTLPSGAEITVIPPPYLLATKLEAFAGRGKGDFLGSRDFSDIITLLDGRAELVEEVRGAPQDLRAYVASTLATLRASPAFELAVVGHLKPDPTSQDRADQMVEPRVDALIEHG